MKWGYKLIIVILLGMGIYAAIRIKKNVDSHPDQMELENQDLIVARQNLADITSNNIVNQTYKEVVITLPPGTFEALEKGTIELIRKDAINKNVQLAIVPNGSNRRTIPKSILLKGMYKSTIKWTNGGKEFYKEESVFVE